DPPHYHDSTPLSSLPAASSDPLTALTASPTRRSSDLYSRSTLQLPLGEKIHHLNSAVVQPVALALRFTVAPGDCGLAGRAVKLGAVEDASELLSGVDCLCRLLLTAAEPIARAQTASR